jgi:predicted enzyme related to lactoylglutathione lyase
MLPMALRWESVCVDAQDPVRLARFWAEVLGWAVTEEDPDEACVEPEGATPTDGPCLLFLKVPETKERKNRLHIDLRPDDQAAEVSRVEALGATRADVGQEGTESWVVLADPEGNEFCVLRALTGDELGEAAGASAAAAPV